MKLFDTRPGYFQTLFAAAALVCIVAVSINLYKLTSSPTDENIFVDPPSFLIVSRSTDRISDVKTGDIILEVENLPTQNTRDSLLKITILKPATNTRATFTVSKDAFADLKIRSIPPYVLVVGVVDGGASDRAGMKVGDLILSINGQTFWSAVQADSILRSGTTGKSFVYNILRENTELDLHIVLASVGIPLFVLGFTITSLLFLGLAILLATKRPNLNGSRLLSLACLMAFLAPLAFPYNQSPNSSLFLILVFLSGGAYALAVAFFAHSLLYFPARRTEMLTHGWIRPVIYLLGLLPVAGGIARRGSGFGLGLLLQIILTTVLFLFFRKYQQREQRLLLRPFKFAISITVALILIVGRFYPQSATFATFLSTSIPLSLFYCIARYRLFDLNLRVRKNVQFSFASTVWTVALVTLFIWLLFLLPRQSLQLPNIHLTGASIEVLPTALQPREQTIAEKTFLMIAGIALALLFLRVGKAGYNFLAGKFHRGGYDYRRAAHRMAEVLASTLTMEGLARGIAEKLSEMMSLKRVGVMFFRNQETCCCDMAHGFDGTEWKKFCFSQRNTIAEWLKPFAKEFAVDSLPAEIRPVFQSQEIQIVVPIHSKDKLIGALLIGEKRSETAFHQEDYEFLSSTAKQASVAVENSFLYEELAGQERMKHELGIARQIQLSSLPQTTPDIAGLEIAGMSVPAFEVGGDYFDYLNGELDKFTVIVGDVSGKGTSAALYMSKVQGILHSLHSFGLTPRELFIRTNTVLRNDLSQKAFVTAFGAAFNVKANTIKLARAGHLPLLHYESSTKNIRKLLPKGLGMGMSPEKTFAENLEEQTISYATGDVFVFVTDGITEGRTLDNEEFGDARLVTLFNESVQASASEIRDKILAAVKEFAGEAQQHDDQTVVVVKAV